MEVKNEFLALAPLASFAPFALLAAIKLFQKTLKKRNNIAVISANGTISYSSKPGNLFYDTLSLLHEVSENKNYAALILRVNSPGGTVGASQELYDAILRVRKNGTKVIASMTDTAASGGLYLCMAADYVIANPGTITGSIGVIFQNYGYAKLLERFQIEARVITAGQNKDMLSPTREVTKEERALIQGIADDVHKQFQTAVAEGCHLPLEEVEKFADGRIMSGSQALACGLIDSCGSFADALEAAQELAGIPEGTEKIAYLQAKPPFGGVLSGLIKQSILGKSNVLKDALPGANLPTIPLWLMPGYDL